MHDACVVEQNVEFAKFAFGKGDHLFAIGGFGNVGVNISRVAARRLNQADGLLAFGVIDVYANDRRAFFGE